MRCKKVRLSAILLLGLGLTGLKAQQAVPASGGDASGSGGSSSYSVGQMVYTTKIGANGSVAEGVQQPWEISIITGIAEAKGIALQCVLFPNPTADIATLTVDNYKSENLWYQLFDKDGKQLESANIPGDKTTISMGSLAAATYFLKVTDNNKEVKTFKIIKN